MSGLWIGISVAVMLQPDGEMIVRTVPNTPTTYEECLTWKQDLESMPMPEIDPVSKFPMVGRFYNCDPAP